MFIDFLDGHSLFFFAIEIQWESEFQDSSLRFQVHMKRKTETQNKPPTVIKS